jgi:hypothetical protein
MTELELDKDIIKNMEKIKLQLSASVPLDINRFNIDREKSVLVISTQEAPTFMWPYHKITYWHVNKRKIRVEPSKLYNDINYVEGGFRYYVHKNKLPRMKL